MLCSNPIIPGFAPDPSLCRVGEDYYLVNSTFAYFPGVPVFHSRDLAHWEQIGNVLERSSQIPLAGCGHSEGIFAPTIRFHGDTFYMITTNLTGGGNFLVTAQDPAGPWSEPHYLGDAARGIDPSLFFDADGSCYYIGQRENPAGGEYFGDCEIWIRRLDLDTMQLTGREATVLRGFQRRAVWAEGPHLYYKDGYYYILHAESGTEFWHCVAVARSRSIFGPYEYCPSNPILTHRHLGMNYPVTCVGHGDLVEDGRGNWYMAVLACRPEQGYTLMGRETFLAKVVWENGWPVVNPGVGRLEEYVELPAPGDCGVGQDLEPQTPGACGAEKIQDPGRRFPGCRCETRDDLRAERYDFTGDTLPPQFLMLRNPEAGTASLGERTGFLRLRMRPETLRDLASPAYVGVRQRDREYEAETTLQPVFCDEGDCAGMAIVQSNENHIRLECFQADHDPEGSIQEAGGRTASGQAGHQANSGQEERQMASAPEGQRWIRLVACRKGTDTVLAVDRIASDDPEIRLRISVHGLSADFYQWTGEGWKPLASGVDLRFLSTEESGGFVGCTVGMYASANGGVNGGFADFAGFSYLTRG